MTKHLAAQRVSTPADDPIIAATSHQQLHAGNLLYREPELDEALAAAAPSRLVDAVSGAVDEYLHEPGAVLDLGCGTGRILRHLASAQEGLHNAVGIDVQPGLISYARARAPQVTWRVGDIRYARLVDEFDLVLCTGNVLAYLHSEQALRDAFDTMAFHTRPGTLLLLSTLIDIPEAAATGVAEDRRQPVTAMVPGPSGPVTVTAATTPEADTRVMVTTRDWVFPDGSTAHDRFRRRVWSRGELITAARRAGFTDHLAVSEELTLAARIPPAQVPRGPSTRRATR